MIIQPFVLTAPASLQDAVLFHSLPGVIVELLLNPRLISGIPLGCTLASRGGAARAGLNDGIPLGFRNGAKPSRKPEACRKLAGGGAQRHPR